MNLAAGFGFALPSRHDLAEHRRATEARLAGAVPWTDTTRWQRELTIKASTYVAPSLFDVKPLPGPSLRGAKPGSLVLSPSGRWAYCEKRLPRGSALDIYRGRSRGDVMFDGPVILPALHERWPSNTNDGWRPVPWMSITPMEILTLRAGTRLARGHVVVAGLGLGYQLAEVARRPKVTRVTLVERDPELVEWLMPRLTPRLGRPVDVIVDDAYAVLPKLAADVALVDIFAGYGCNGMEAAKLRNDCRAIKKLWAWGAVEV